MHILFLTDNFPPESNAPASRTYEHAVRWVRNGVKVTIITCTPNFPEGEIFDGYKNKIYQKENMDGIQVIRVKTYITANEGFIPRTLDYMSFMVSGFIAGLFQRKIDIIVATSPQFFTVCAGWMLSVFRRKPFVFELRDLWPASIVAVGAMKDSRSIKLLEKIELFLYHKASLIISVTNSFKQELIERGVNKEKISVVINGVDLDRYHQISAKDKILVEKYKLTNKFIVGYVGTHGMAHSLDVVLDSAKHLQEYPEIVFMLVGSGSAKSELMNKAKKQNLQNIIFIDRQPKDMMTKYWSLCDLSFIHLKNNPLFSSVIPSKLFESMGMGLPVIMALPDGEATTLVKQYNCGVAIQPEDAEQLTKTIIELKENSDQLYKYKQSSLKASLEFSRDVKANEMLELLRSHTQKL